MTSICEKKSKFHCRISSFNRRRSVGVLLKVFRWRCSAKNMFLKILNIHRKTPVLESFYRSSGPKFYLKKTPTLILFCEYCQTFKITYFEEHSWTSASYFMKKNRQSWRLNNSSEKFLNQWKSIGKDTQRKFSFRAFHEIQFQGQFMKHEILS